MTPRHVGEMLKRYRDHRGITQLALAKELGLETCQMISNVERGLSVFPAARLSRLDREWKDRFYCAYLLDYLHALRKDMGHQG